MNEFSEFSERKKAEKLEKAVLLNDVDEVNRVFDKYEDIKFTERALGMACRFSGYKMVALLLRKGATFFPNKGIFHYELSLFREFDIHLLSSLCGRYIPEFPNELADKCEILSDIDRAAILRLLIEKKAVDPDNILYYSIMYDDSLYQELNDLGIRRILPKHRDWLRLRAIESVADTYSPGNQLSMLHDIPYNYNGKLSEYGIDTAKVIRIVERLRAAGDGGKISTVPASYFCYYGALRRQYISAELRNCFVQNTTMTETIKKGICLARALVDQGDADGLQYAFDEKWIHGVAMTKKILEYAIERNASADVIACIMEESKKLQDRSNKSRCPTSGLLLSNASGKQEPWKYVKQDDGTIRITSYVGRDENIIVPAKIQNKPVTEIRPDAFHAYTQSGDRRYNVTKDKEKIIKEIKSVEFSGTIEKIPSEILCDSRNVEKIVVKEGVSVLDDYAFSSCSATEIVMPTSLKMVGESAFQRCSSLKKIVLPYDIKRIGGRAFKKCTALEEFSFLQSQTSLTEYAVSPDCSDQGQLKEIPEETFDECQSLRKIVLPDSVEKIGKYAFHECKKLETVHLPSSLLEIQDYAFEDCFSLKKIFIPDSVEKIGINAFQGCKNLKSIHLPEKLRVLSQSVFEDCRSLTEVDIPINVERIERNAFQNCTSLREVKFPDKLKEILQGAFRDCTALKHITVPCHTKIEDDAFYGCYDLADENGRIIVNGSYFGGDRMRNFSLDECITPMELPNNIKSIRAIPSRMPLIIYRPFTISPDPENQINISKLVVNDEIQFGRFPQGDDFQVLPLQWRVISKNKRHALLITVKEILCFRFYSFPYEDTMSNISILLNRGIFPFAFTEKERLQIEESKIRIPGKRQLSAVNMFILSAEEVEKYIPHMADRTPVSSSYAVKQKEYYTVGKAGHAWILREEEDKFKRNGIDSDRGVLIDEANGTRFYPIYIRPAIWVKNL